MMRPLMVGIMVVDYQYSTEKSECIGDRTGLRQQVQRYYIVTHSAKRVQRHVACFTYEGGLSCIRLCALIADEYDREDKVGQCLLLG